MYCDKCGKELPEGIQRCMDCYPREPREKKRLLRRILIAAGAVVAAAGIALAASLYFAPSAVVQRAVAKSISALNAQSELLSVPGLTAPSTSPQYSSSAYLQLERLAGLDPEIAALVKGLGLRVENDADLSARRYHSALSLDYGAAELVRLSLFAEDTDLMVGAPLLLGDTLLGVDTTTLGQELRRLGVEDEALTGLSFDFFELVTLISDYSKTYNAALEKAARQMASDIKVEKVGKTVYPLGSESFACTEYIATLPQDALRKYLSVYDAQSDLAEITVMKLLTSLGLPEEELAVDLDSGEDDLASAVDLLGDMELHLFLSGGRILGVTWSPTIEGVRVTLSLSLAGETYGEDVTLQLTGSDGSEEAAVTMNILSREEKNSASGEIILTAEMPGSEPVDMEFAWSYAPKAEEENLTLQLFVNDAKFLSAIGQLDMTETDYTLLFDEICLYDGNRQELICLSGGVERGPYTAPEQEGDVWMLSEMSAEELQALPEQISLVAQFQLAGLLAQHPQLASLLGLVSA